MSFDFPEKKRSPVEANRLWVSELETGIELFRPESMPGERI